MRGNISGLLIFYLIALLLCVSCGPQATVVTETPPANTYAKEIALALEKVKEHPEDADAIRELGILYFKSGQFDKAIPLLEKTDRLKANEPRTTCYLGLSYEMAGQLDPALAAFLRYLQLPPQSLYRKWLKGRHDLLLRRKIRDETIALLLRETPADSGKQLENSVLVLPFDYHGKDQKYFLLGKGLQALIINDLQPVEGIKTLDRLHTQIFLEEVSRRDSLLKNVENRTAWMGKKLKSQTVVKGGYNIIDDTQLIVDFVYWNINKEEIPNTITRPGELKNIFKIQKDIVLGLLEKRQINLKPALRDSILRMPTENISAFVAYSAGLAKEDAGAYREAVVFYRKALELAPQFRECTLRIEENEALALALRDPDKAITENDFANNH